MESVTSVKNCGNEGNVIDAGKAEVMRVRRNGNLELPRQVRKRGIALEFFDERPDNRLRIDALLRINAHERIAENISRTVSAGFRARQARRMKTPNDLVKYTELKPMNLNGVTIRDLNRMTSECRRNVSQRLGLFGR